MTGSKNVSFSSFDGCLDLAGGAPVVSPTRKHAGIVCTVPVKDGVIAEALPYSDRNCERGRRTRLPRA